jgi:hypothetical protein
LISSCTPSFVKTRKRFLTPFIHPFISLAFLRGLTEKEFGGEINSALASVGGSA